MLREAIQLAKLVDVSDHAKLFEEIQLVTRLILPSFDFKYVSKVYNDMETLFNGEYAGYRACNTKYHDISHTHQVLLAMLRLMHGAFISGVRFSEKEMNISLISALMHDTGYIQESSDLTGTGAKYTQNHIQRSIDFVYRYFSGIPMFEDSLNDFADILNCTGLTTKTKEIKFSSPKTALLGKMLGTADILGQMSDRFYLEKLLFLYIEFQEAGIKGYTSELDLLEKTPFFYEMTKNRFVNELGSANNYAVLHFRERWNINLDLYDDAINNNLECLKKLLRDHRYDYLSFLRRGQLASKFEELR